MNLLYLRRFATWADGLGIETDAPYYDFMLLQLEGELSFDYADVYKICLKKSEFLACPDRHIPKTDIISQRTWETWTARRPRRPGGG